MLPASVQLHLYVSRSCLRFAASCTDVSCMLVPSSTDRSVTFLFHGKFFGFSLFGVGGLVGWRWLAGSLGVWMPRCCSPPPCGCLIPGGFRVWSCVTGRAADANCTSRSDSGPARVFLARMRGAGGRRARCMMSGTGCGGTCVYHRFVLCVVITGIGQGDRLI